MSAPTCMECGNLSRLTDGREIYPHRPDLFAKSFYKCKCGAYCGCHPGSTEPLGFPCGQDTRNARSAAHSAFDPIWKKRAMTRGDAYRWLSKRTGIATEKCHIGMMTADQARLVVEVCRNPTS